MRIAILFNDRLALPALQQLVQSGLVVAVGTSERSSEMIGIMKQIALQAKVPSVIFSKKNMEADMTEWLQKYKPEVVLVKTFPYKIPSSVLNIPRYGFINFHYAPLPAYRGSNPLFWMIKEQAEIGGVTIHLMDENYDSGSILFQRQIPISPNDTFGMYSTKLAYIGLEMTAELLQSLSSEKLNPQLQQGNQGRWYGRPSVADMTINWISMTALQVIALVNACNPWLKGAITKINGWTFGITKASVVELSVPDNMLPGTILELDEDKLIISCSQHTALKVDILYCEEGYYLGAQLAAFGFKNGQKLGT